MKKNNKKDKIEKKTVERTEVYKTPTIKANNSSTKPRSEPLPFVRLKLKKNRDEE